MYIQMLEQTQAFSEFIFERESKKSSDPLVKLFDEIILCKKNRGKTGFFSRTKPTYLADTSEHIWRTSSTISAIVKGQPDPRISSSRIPAKLDPVLLRPPRVNQGVPVVKGNPKRKPLTQASLPNIHINGRLNGEP